MAGAILGAATLVRTQSVGLVVVVLLLSFLVIPDRKQWLLGSIALGLALAVTLVPWLARNYAATGGIVLDNPISQVMTMARRWSGSWGNELLPRLAGESDSEYSSRMTQIAIEAFKQDPQFILNTAANHFINSEIASIMAFPVRDEIRSPDELLIPQRSFWSTTIHREQFPVFLFYLVLFALGVAVIFHHYKWIGLFPLALGLVYNAWTALFFSSGERFVVPLDWSIYLYQWMGLLSLGTLVLTFTRGANTPASFSTRSLSDDHSVDSSSRFFARYPASAAIALAVIVGAFTPFTEFIFPQKYPPITPQVIQQVMGVTLEEG
jgi:hypothetical protein